MKLAEVLMNADPKIIVALDIETKKQAEEVVSKLDPSLCRLKVGKSLFTTLGPEWIKYTHSLGFDVFLDLKFHDIPFQVACSCREAAKLGIWMVNVHALGGSKMMQAAREAVDKQQQISGNKTILIAVTLLTSHSQTDLADLGLSGTVEENVLRLAELSKSAGMDGVVCSAQEVPKIKMNLGKEFLCVTPGIRLANQSKDDQVRVLTPKDALKAGSDYLVMGRSILESAEPNQVLAHILEDVENELV